MSNFDNFFQNEDWEDEEDDSHYMTDEDETETKEEPELEGYDPATYEIDKPIDWGREPESQEMIQKGFARRASRLIELHRQSAEIRDGLEGFSEKESLLKAVEAPTKLKKYFKHLIKRVDKTGIKLDPNGNIDWIKVKPSIKGRWEPKAKIIEVALKMRDLEFEYP